MPRVKKAHIRDWHTNEADHVAPRDRPTLLRPDEVIAPGAGPISLLTQSPARMRTSATDTAPPADRPGQDNNLGYPSRHGDRLHYRSGLITDMAGNPIHPQP